MPMVRPTMRERVNATHSRCGQASLTAYNPYAHGTDIDIPNEKVNLQSSSESIADMERNVEVKGTAHSRDSVDVRSESPQHAQPESHMTKHVGL